MAIDGSFRIDNALNEFLHSHPELASHLSYLSDKGGNLIEEELIDGVAELILYLQLVGCFRPIVRKIVDRAVVLLHLVPNLLRDSMLDFDEGSLFSESGSSDCEEVVSIINSYKRCERGLRLHEISCLAFSRMLALVPDLLGSVRNYFMFAPPPFQRIVEKKSMAPSLVQDGAYILDATRVTYHLLQAKPEVFGGLWEEWSCYMDLVHEIRSLNGVDIELLMDIRWSAVQILIVVLKTNDRLTLVSPDFGFDDEEAFGCHARWKKYSEDVPKEQAIWYLEPYNESTSGSSEEEINFDPRQNSLSLGVGSTNWSNMDATWDMRKTGTPFVITSAVKESYEMVMLFVSQRWPVLYGPAGACKTALINRLAQGHGSRVLSIHMDEQIGGKTLVGSYICAEQPGEFRWQPGSLTQAILNGLWVVFEDIDKAPADVQSILLPLLEGSTSFLTGHGENLSQQSDIADLLGGFKPMNAQFVCFPLYGEFEILFTSTFSSKNNKHFLAILRKFATDKKWNSYVMVLKRVSRKWLKLENPKRKRPLDEELLKKWDIFSTKLEAAHAQINASDGMVFSFVALKKGEWILLDEINLAPPETLQRVNGVLEDEVGSLCFAKRGDVDYISRHPNFHICLYESSN